MGKPKFSYEFRNGSLNTDIVEARYAYINKPDPDYDRFSITVVLDPDDTSTKELFDTTLDFENEVRAKQGLDVVEIPANWTRKGKPSKDDKGMWLVSIAMKPLDKDNNPRSPKVYDIFGKEDSTIQIWGGDRVIVQFGLGVWYDKDTAGSKYFLSAVQQIKSGSGGGTSGFADMSGVVAKESMAKVNTLIDTPDEDDDGIPF